MKINNLYFKTFTKNGKNFYKYLMIYLVILLLISLTLFIKNYNNDKIYQELNLKENRRLLIYPNENNNLDNLLNILYKTKAVESFDYEINAIVNNYFISNYFNTYEDGYYSENKILYSSFDVDNLNIEENKITINKKDNIYSKYELQSNKAMSEYLIRNNYCSNWNIRLYLKSYKQVNYVSNILRENNIQYKHISYNSLEIKSFEKLENLINYCIFFELIITGIIIILVIANLLIDQKKDLILLKSIGYSNYKICFIFLNQVILINLVSFLVFMFIFCALALLLYKIKKYYIILLIKSIILPIIMVLLISVIMYIIYFTKIKNTYIKTLK